MSHVGHGVGCQDVVQVGCKRGHGRHLNHPHRPHSESLPIPCRPEQTWIFGGAPAWHPTLDARHTHSQHLHSPNPPCQPGTRIWIPSYRVRKAKVLLDPGTIDWIPEGISTQAPGFQARALPGFGDAPAWRLAWRTPWPCPHWPPLARLKAPAAWPCPAC